MTKNQLTKAMTMMGISQIALAERLSTNPRTVRYWMTGEWPVPVPIALLINLMIDTRTELKDLRVNGDEHWPAAWTET